MKYIKPLLLMVFLVFLSFTVKADVYIWKSVNGVRNVSNIKPDWWTEEMDLIAPGEVTAPSEENLPGKFVGDRENLKFHWPKCIQIYNPQGKLAIPVEKRIWFKSYQDAINNGYYVCDHCQPSEDGLEYQPKTP